MTGPDFGNTLDLTPHPTTQPGRGIRALLDQTFELEMLISGAVLFLALQLPGWLDGLITTIQRSPRSAEGLFITAFMAKGVIYVFIVNQLLHLVARMLWVGTVGMRAQHPEGPDSARMTMSSKPAKAYLLAHFGDLGQAQDRLERMARILFSIAIGFAIILLNSVLLFSIGFGLSALFELALPGVLPPMAMILLLGFTPLTLLLVDRLLDHPRLNHLRGPRVDRVLRPFSTSTFLPGLGLVMPMMLTMSTRMHRWAYILLMVLYFLVFTGTTLGPLFWGVTTNTHYRANGPMSRSAWYEPTHQPMDALYRGPILHTEVLGKDERYLHVFLPVDGALLDSLASAHPVLNRIGQPSFQQIRPTDSLALAQARDAYMGAYAMTMDGTPVPPQAFRWYHHPRLAMEGLQAYLYVDSLAPGPHTLRTLRPFRKPLVWDIPFYR